MGRNRSPLTRGLPPNLYPNPSAGRVYYRYRFPDGRFQSLGADKATAITAAYELNQHFGSAGLSDRALTRHARPSRANPAIPALIAEYRAHVLDRKPYSRSHRDGIDIRLRQYQRAWPECAVQGFSTRDIAAFLNHQSIYQYVAHRRQLVELFQFACHQGYRNDNPAERTLVKSRRAADKARQRHSLDGYRAIHAIAEPWLQRAMDILLYSLQRRDDVVNIQRSDLDLARGTITLLQRKTRNYAHPVYLAIEMGAGLKGAVNAALSSGVPCPHLVHRRPKRMPAAQRRAAPHPFAVSPDRLTRAFAAARDASGAYAHLAPEQRPTVHELRALGAHLYQAAGYSDDYIMALTGHADRRMLAHYTKDHQQAAPKLVRADLDLPHR